MSDLAISPDPGRADEKSARIVYLVRRRTDGAITVRELPKEQAILTLVVCRCVTWVLDIALSLVLTTAGGLAIALLISVWREI